MQPQKARRVCGSPEPCTSGSTASRTVRVPASVGDPLSAVETPALVCDLDRAEANMRHFEDTMREFPGVRLRPHFKSHKSVDLCKLQLQSPLVSGFCCQKTSEVEAMAEAGISDILLTNEVVVERKINRLLGLLQRYETLRLAVLVDDPAEASKLSSLAAHAKVELGVLVELDCGGGRCGVTSVQECVSLAQRLHALPALRFQGIHAYHGTAQHLRTPQERKAAIDSVVLTLLEVRSRLGELQVPCAEITGGGTGTYLHEAASGVYTEVQAGSFFFNDVDYGANQDAHGVQLSDSEWQFSLSVLSTVMSRNEQRRKCVTDAGMKSHSVDSGPPRLLPAVEGAEVRNGGDEHLIITYAEGSAVPQLGSQVSVVPGHCDPTVNLHDFLVATRRGVVVGVFPLARGPGF